MAIFEWRKFNFFDLKPNADQGKISESLKEATITASTNGNNQIILCDSNGFVHVFNRNWLSTTFKGHDSQITHCELAKEPNILITIGTEDNGTIPVFKVWNLTRLAKLTGLVDNEQSFCLRTVRAALQKPTSLAVSDNGQYMAIGFDRGSISLYRGDIARDRTKTVKTLSSGTTPITGLAFKQTGKSTQMFVCSESGILVYNLQGKDKEVKIILDATAKSAQCSVLQGGHGLNDSHFMVGQDDAVYCYTIDGRGPCYALEGKKSIIQWFRSHLLTISKPTQHSISTQKNFVLTIIDVQNKFIVFTAPIDSPVAILVEFGTCFILTATNECFHLDEKDLQSKLSLLFKKNQYDIAVRIANSNQYDAEGLADIFKNYGDHLYSKGNFARAVDQYIKTIGYLEPSYVIRKFLDSRHIHYLTDYLQALHRQGVATADHTTLILNCFTRLDKTDRLEEFLRADKSPNCMFDLNIAINVCRSACPNYALELAGRHQKHDLYLSILIDDMGRYEDAIEYISVLSLTDAETNLKRHGLHLMEHCPEQTTKLLKKLCTNFSPSVINGTADIFIHDSAGEIERANPEDFIHLFLNSSEMIIDFLEHLINNGGFCSPLLYSTLIQLYLIRWQEDKSIETRLLAILKNQSIVYDRDYTLILCRSFGFWPGIMLIYEDQKLYHLIVRYYLKVGDYNNLLTCCKRLGNEQPSLWLQALTGLRNDKDAPPNLLAQILQVIATEKLQSPLQVLNCIAVDDGPNLSSVREYFLQMFEKENESSKKEEEFVDKYKEDSIALNKHIKYLQGSPLEFRNTLCDTCLQALTMPALYFLCRHAYHQDCVRGYSENGKDCPVCHTKNIQLVNALRVQSESRGKHDYFHDLLDGSTDPFTIVAEHFSCGMFNKLVIFDEDDRQFEINKNVIEKQSVATPVINYGSGAEAKLRIEEDRTLRQDSNINRISIPEGRVRLQETTRHSTSLPVKQDKPLRRSPIDTKLSKNLPAPKSIKLVPKNPFDEDDGPETSQGPSTNPFDEDDIEEAIEIAKKPLEEYNNNLNPFA